jgi:hypothetical protein
MNSSLSTWSLARYTRDGTPGRDKVFCRRRDGMTKL